MKKTFGAAGTAPKFYHLALASRAVRTSAPDNKLRQQQQQQEQKPQ